MAKVRAERKSQTFANATLGRDLMVVCILTTLTITPSLTIDAFNPPKFFVMSLGIFYIVLRHRIFLVSEFQRNSSGIILLVGIVVSLLALVAHSYSFSERFFGIERRNFGFITIICFFTLGAVAFAAGRSKVIESRVVHLGLTIANFFVSIIFLLQLNGVAFTNFQNAYGVLPSTLGNPNFLSAFLAVSITGIFGWISHPRTHNKWKYWAIAQVAASIWIIAKTQSVQGFVTLAVGAITLLHLIARKFLPRLVYWFFSTLTLVSASMFFLGMLGVGLNLNDKLPSTLLYRIIYWKIGFQMVWESPILGLGFDTYLDNFRRHLQPSYVSKLGEGVISDSPHNLFLDFFVSGGIVLGLFGSFCVVLSLLKCLKIWNKSKMKQIQISSDEILVVILIMYLAVACISPFQLSLFIWLPLVIGLISSFDGYDKSKRLDSKENYSEKKVFRFAAIGAIWVISLSTNPLISILPMATEIRYRIAVETGNFHGLKGVALAWPFSGARANAIAQGMLNSSLGVNSSADKSTQEQLQTFRDTASEIAILSTSINPNYFESWRFLHANSSKAEIKLLAIENLRRLDPYNPEWWANNR